MEQDASNTWIDRLYFFFAYGYFFCVGNGVSIDAHFVASGENMVFRCINPFSSWKEGKAGLFSGVCHYRSDDVRDKEAIPLSHRNKANDLSFLS